MKKPFLYFLFLGISLSIFSQEQLKAEMDYVIEDSVMIPTKSGIAISSTIVKREGIDLPLPVVLFYTTYYQGTGDSVLGKRSADKGYVGVVAYARGIRANLDDYAPYEHEGEDIYDVIDWISKQPWCNGSVGMYGGSYTGFSQWAAAKNLHPALKTIVPQVAVMPGFDMPMENNVPTGNVLSWANDNIYKFPYLRRSLPFEWFENGTSFRSLDSLAEQPNPIFRKWLSHPSYDEYWQSMVPTKEEYGKINIPVLSTTGYYDGAQLSALEYFILHNKYNRNADHYFVIGPYDHWGGQRRFSPEIMGYRIDSVAMVNMQDVAFDWLNYVLKGGPKPAILKDKFNYQVMGANEWKHASSMDRINSDSLTFYLASQGTDSTGTLVLKKPNKGYKSQLVDFQDRERQNNFFTPTIIFDTLDSSNGLVYSTEPFKSAFTISGNFTGQLAAAVNKKDMDISVSFYEQMSDGRYFLLTRYVGRASYAKDNAKRQLLVSGKKEIIPFTKTRFISKQIGVGSRLVILLNVNKHPFEIINYGSGKEVSDETIKDAGESMKIKWFSDSFICIPVSR